MGLPLSAKDITPTLPLPSNLGKSKEKSVSSSIVSKPQAKDQKDKAPIAAAKKDTKSSSSSSTASSSKPKKHETSGPVAKASLLTTASPSPSKKQANASKAKSGGRLARLTAYWAGEGDYYTSHGLSATGIRLHGGHCAVDPRIIPYGSTVKIDGVGTYLAVDTGSAVISREAAREAGHTTEERNALVIDLFFENQHDGKKFAANGPKFASISWQTPRSADNEPQESSHLYADETVGKPHNKQL